jgi:hypothetical protein
MPRDRQGAFAANFSPDTLSRFRDLCKQQDRQYTKVLERLAVLYLETNGEVLNSPSVPRPVRDAKAPASSVDAELLQDLLKRLEQLVEDYKNADDHLEEIVYSLTERDQKLEQ